MLKKSLIIISLVKKRKALYLKNTHKFGIELPKSVAQAYALDENNGNILWEDSIDKKIKDVSPAFSKLDHGDIVPIGYQVVNCPMIFDVKMEYFHLKDRLVAGGNVIEPPATITYSMVL